MSRLRSNTFSFDRSNEFGRHCVWAMFPEQIKAVGTDTTATGGGVSIGQQRFFALELFNSGFGQTFRIEADRVGFLGAAAVMRFRQGLSGRLQRLINTTDDLGIIFPDASNLSIISIIQPSGGGDLGGNADPRIFSKDLSSAAADHDLMIGIERAGVARSRIRTGGSVATIVSTTNIQDDRLNLIAGMVIPSGGSVLHHIREDMSHSRVTGGSGSYTPRTTTDIAIGANAGSIANPYEGHILCICAFDRAFDSKEALQRLFYNPRQVLESDEFVFPEAEVAGGQTIPIGLLTETDTPQSFGHSKARVLGLNTETDLAQPMTRVKSQLLGLNTEANSLFAMAFEKAKAIGLLTETDTAQPFTRSKARSIGLVTEADVAQAMSALKTREINQLIENDIVFPVSVGGALTVAIGLLTETDVAQSFGKLKQKPIGLLTETDIVQAISAVKARPIGLLTEVSTLFSFAAAKAKEIGLLTEVNTALVMSRDKALELGILTEADSLFPLTSAKAKSLGLLTETDIVFSIAPTGPAVTIITNIVERDVMFTVTLDADALFTETKERDALFTQTRQVDVEF